MKHLLLVALATTAASSAHAWEPNLYLGANYSSWQYSQSDPKLYSDMNFWTIEGVAGIKLFPYVTIEGRAGMGINSDRASAEPGSSGTLELEATYFGSVYFRPVIENERASLYGLLGYTTVELDGEPLPADADYSYSGVSVGLGASFVATPNVDVNLEWKRLLNAEAITMHGPSVGFTYTF